MEARTRGAATAAGDTEGAVRLLTRAHRGLAERKARWEAAVAALWLAEALESGGDRGRAADHLREATEVFDTLRSRPEVAAATTLEERLRGG